MIAIDRHQPPRIAMTRYDSFFLPDAGSESPEALIAAADACLEAFTAAFNRRDLAGMDAQLHFPHTLLSGAQCLVWQQPGQLPASFFDQLAATGWTATVYAQKTPILASADKVHFRVIYTRRGGDGNVLSQHDNVWIVTRVRQRWGIALRSY